MSFTRAAVPFLVALSATLFITLVPSMFQRRRNSRTLSTDCGNKEAPGLKSLQNLGLHFEVAAALAILVEEDGAGSWPPRANHDEWPLALRPYKHIYLELVHLLPTANPSLDDETNNKRRHKFRSLMRKLLTERVHMDKVEAIMKVSETGNWDLFPRDAYNGFYCCVAVLRHAYRCVFAVQPCMYH